MAELTKEEWSQLMRQAGCTRVAGTNIDAETMQVAQREARGRGIDDLTVQLITRTCVSNGRVEEAPGIYLLASNKAVVTQALINLLTPPVAGGLIGALASLKRAEEMKGDRAWIQAGFVGEMMGLLNGGHALVKNDRENRRQGTHSRRDFIEVGVAAAGALLPSTAKSMEQRGAVIRQLEDAEAPQGFAAALRQIDYWYVRRGLRPNGIQGVQI